MGAITKIEWADASWTPIRARLKEKIGAKAKNALGWHCEHISEACRFCYAEGMNRRLGTGLDFKPGHRGDIDIHLDENMLRLPLHWKKPRKIFVCSMTDLFADFVKDEWIDRVFAVMALASQHTFQILTKRADRMRQWFAVTDRADHVGLAMLAIVGRLPYGHRQVPWPFPNVWLGVSAERQQEANERTPHLLQTPAAVRFVSCEPLLGPIDLTCVRARHWSSTQAIHALTGEHNPSLRGWGDFGRLDQVIVGGESGRNARPMHPDWARSLRNQCAAAGVPYFFKQWGEWAPKIDRDKDDPDWRKDYTVTQFKPDRYRILNLAGGFGFHGERVHLMERVGKTRAGRLLDGREWNEFPRGRA